MRAGSWPGAWTPLTARWAAPPTAQSRPRPSGPLRSPAAIPQVHSKDKKYACKSCSRVFVSAASVGIKHGSRRHGVCADCAGRGVAGSLDHGGAEGSPEPFASGGPYLEDPDDPRGEGEELLGEDEDDVGLAHRDALLGEDKDDEDSPPGPRSPSGAPDKGFAWIS